MLKHRRMLIPVVFNVSIPVFQFCTITCITTNCKPLPADFGRALYLVNFYLAAWPGYQNMIKREVLSRNIEQRLVDWLMISAFEIFRNPVIRTVSRFEQACLNQSLCYCIDIQYGCIAISGYLFCMRRFT